LDSDRKSPKPHNYFNDLSPERQQEINDLDAMAAQTEKYRKISEAVIMFESFQRWLDTANPSFCLEVEEERPIPKVNPMPPMPRRRRRTRPPLLEEVMLRRGLIQEV
jgi:hypothetical protein